MFADFLIEYSCMNFLCAFLTKEVSLLRKNLGTEELLKIKTKRKNVEYMFTHAGGRKDDTCTTEQAYTKNTSIRNLS